MYHINYNLKQAIRYFNEQIRTEFQNLPTDRNELLLQGKWISIYGIPALHGKYSPEQQIYALEKCKEHGIRAASRLLGVSRRTLQRWCRYYNVKIPRYPPWMTGWRERKTRRRNFWRMRVY
ncbi:MAG: helix-turn-helix domain-containing protein [Candidatus Lokiarchaeota archaeon]|nr:helix-turn-helix domain-containing protein [Candidatus Lokiarchaeota archaeon]